MTPADLKALILETAARTPGVGPLQESRKWGEQTFAPAKANVGSSVRIAERAQGDLALMFICHTNLVEEFRTLYAGSLEFEGNRGIVLKDGRQPDLEALSHCVSLALTYKLRKRAKSA